MEAMLILFIISIQFAITFFVADYLRKLENKLDNLNTQITEIMPKLKPAFRNTRIKLQNANKKLVSIQKFLKNFNKIKNILLFKSALIALIILRKKKDYTQALTLYKALLKVAWA